MLDKNRTAIGLLLVILVTAVVADGGVDEITKSFLAIMAFLLNLILVGRSVPNKVRFVSAASMGILAVVVIAVVAQSVRLPGNPLQNGVWSDAESSMQDLIGGISVAPEQSYASLVTLAPVLVFIAALKLCSGRYEAIPLFRCMAYLTTGAAIWGLVEYLHFLDNLGLPPKQFYSGSLTSFFVNRNSAGTFFGLGVLVWLYLCHSIQRASKLSFTQTLKAIIEGRRILQDLPVSYLICAIVNAVALTLTQSRGALASTVIAIGLYLFLVSTPRPRSIERSPVQRIGKFLLQSAVAAIVILTLLELFAGQAIYRQEVRGIDQMRLCTYRSTLGIAFDDWPLGSGFGTFSNIFPSYRDPECSSIFGTWEMAHNFYLEGAAGLGVVFFLVTAVAYLTLVWSFVSGVLPASRSRKVAALGLSILALITVHSLVDFSLQIPGVANFAAALLGFCVAGSLASRSGSEGATETWRAQVVGHRRRH